MLDPGGQFFQGEPIARALNLGCLESSLEISYRVLEPLQALAAHDQPPEGTRSDTPPTPFSRSTDSSARTA